MNGSAGDCGQEHDGPEAWASAFDALGDAVAIFDREGRVVRCNRAWGDLAGHPPEECRKRIVSELLPEPKVRPSAQAVKTGKRRSAEWPDGERLFRLTADPMFGPLGEVCGAVEWIVDVTEQRRLRRRADEAEAEARESAARIEALEREARVYQHLSQGEGRTAPAAGGRSLKTSDPDGFCDALQRYEPLFDQMLEQREFRVYHQVSAALRDLASRLGEMGAGARDVIEMHGTALRLKSGGQGARRTAALAEEGRLMVLELMGHLVSYYRYRRLSAGGRGDRNSPAESAMVPGENTRNGQILD